MQLCVTSVTQKQQNCSVWDTYGECIAFFLCLVVKMCVHTWRIGSVSKLFVAASGAVLGRFFGLLSEERCFSWEAAGCGWEVILL